MKNKKFIFVGAVILIITLISIVYALNINSSSNLSTSALSEMTLSVAIPCQGHASLIIGELEKAGAHEVIFNSPNLFLVKYDSTKLDKSKILGLDVFKEYPVKEVN